tara:strand:- start:158 stop:454 length:297 start_codon:yes stop_codon:yes gene_type:complete
MSRYENTKIIDIKKKFPNEKSKRTVSRYATTLYSKIEESNNDIYVITQDGDRLDNLAVQFYGDPHLWWYIGHANNIYTMNITGGTSLRIPALEVVTEG